MTVQQLIEKLQRFNPSLEVAILDGFNGGGNPRAINLGPHIESDREAQEMGYDKTDRDYEDLATFQGNEIVILGYGCY